MATDDSTRVKKGRRDFNMFSFAAAHAPTQDSSHPSRTSSHLLLTSSTPPQPERTSISQLPVLPQSLLSRSSSSSRSSSWRPLAFALVIVLLLALADAARGEEPRRAAKPLPHVAVLYDPNIVDTNSDGSGEAYNLRETLSWWGYHYSTIESNALADWQAALAESQVLIFPEPGERGLPNSDDPLGYLGLSVVNQVRMWVAIGGLFVQLGDNLTVVPHIFNKDWPLGGSSQDPSVPTAARSDSVFNGCPYSLSGLDLVYHFNSSLVNTTVCLQYKANTNEGCTLLRDTYGQGIVTWIGFDWYQARPVGTQDGGWLQVLQHALMEAPPPPPSPSASPSQSSTPSISPSSSASQSPSPSISLSPTPSSSPPPTATPSNTPSPSPSQSSSPSSSVSFTPSSSISYTPSTSSSASSSPSKSASISPSRTPSRSATPSNTPAPATGNYPNVDTKLFFEAQGPNVRVTEVRSNTSALLTFDRIVLIDGSGNAFDSISLPRSGYTVTVSSPAEVEMTGVELFGFAGTINSVPLAFNFTHPIRNETQMRFADSAFVVETGAVNWLFSIDGAWPFPTNAAEFSMVVTLALGNAPMNLIERINGKPKSSWTTYTVNHGAQSKGLDLKLEVFDVAIADGEKVQIKHKVELTTDSSGAQVAVFHFTFPAFRYTFLYDPKLVLVVRADSGGTSVGGLIAGSVALIIVGGMVLLAIIRSNSNTPPSSYRGTNHMPVPTDDLQDYTAAQRNGNHRQSKTIQFEAYEDYDEEEEYHNGNNGADDIEMKVLDTKGRPKGKEGSYTRTSPVKAGPNKPVRAHSQTVLRYPAATTEYQWEHEDEGL